MIDDAQTCDVCGEEFNEDRPHHVHTPAKPTEEQGTEQGSKPEDDVAAS